MGGRRAGRKRKSGARYPSGQLKKVDKSPDDRVRTSRQPHRRALKTDDRLSEKAESLLGRLLLAGLLNDGTKAKGKRPTSDEPSTTARGRYHVGELYAQVVGVYTAQLGGPRLGALRLAVDDESLPADDEEDTGARDRGCSSASADPIERQVRFGSQVITVREWPCRVTGDGCACARRKARYDGAFEALSLAGRRALMVVNRVAVHGEAIAPQDLVYLNLGLDALARHFGLTRPARRAQSRNAH